MNALPRIALAAALACSATFALAQAAATTQKVAKAKMTNKSSASRQQLKADAAPEAEAFEAVSDAQLAVAQRVMTGKADCEFNQQVQVQAVEGKPGHFKLGFKNATYHMVPEETTTGAVRLEDKRAGVVWLQIPTKSMLMNHKIGQRLVDACQHDEQRVAAEGARAAPKIGIAQ